MIVLFLHCKHLAHPDTVEHFISEPEHCAGILPQRSVPFSKECFLDNHTVSVLPSISHDLPTSSRRYSPTSLKSSVSG